MTTPHSNPAAQAADLLEPLKMDLMEPEHYNLPGDFNQDKLSIGQPWQENPLPTPPTSQKLHVEHDPTQDIEQGVPLVSSPTQVVNGPLLLTQEAPSSPSLPEPFNQPFTFARFQLLVEDHATGKYSLRKYLGSDIEIKVFDSRLVNAPSRVTSFQAFYEAARTYSKLVIPGAEPECGADTRNTFASCLKTPWSEALRVAYAGALVNVPSGKPDTREIVMEKYYEIHPSSRPSTKARKSSRRKQSPSPPPRDQSEPRKSSRTSRKPTAKATPEAAPLEATPPIAANVAPTAPRLILRVSPQPASTTTLPAKGSSVTPKPASNKRKRASPKETSQTLRASSTPESAEESSVSPKPASKRRKQESPKEKLITSKKVKRVPYDPNHEDPKDKEKRDNGAERATRFGKAVKAMFNERSADVLAYAKFEDALSILPQDRSHEQEEQALAKKFGWPWERYLCQKYRFFLGVAVQAEQNFRLQEQSRHLPVKNQPALFKINITQAQNFNSMDVNKISEVFRKYQEWNWVVGEMVFKDESGWHLDPAYLEEYPANLRKSLMDQLIEWEDRVVWNVNNKVVAHEQHFDVEMD